MTLHTIGSNIDSSIGISQGPRSRGGSARVTAATATIHTSQPA